MRRRVGALIALFERAVGLYASLIDVNAYHQPGVEAGKQAAAAALALQGARARRARATSRAARRTSPHGPARAEQAETVYLLLEHLCASGRARLVEPGPPGAARFALPRG